MLSSISGGTKKGVCNNQSDKKSEVNKMVEITKDDWEKVFDDNNEDFDKDFRELLLKYNNNRKEKIKLGLESKEAEHEVEIAAELLSKENYIVDLATTGNLDDYEEIYMEGYDNIFNLISCVGISGNDVFFQLGTTKEIGERCADLYNKLFRLHFDKQYDAIQNRGIRGLIRRITRAITGKQSNPDEE